ncbi:MAG: efflux RND transporter permease subunit [Chloroflexi bacterium]|nr:efflux RND transporter permease subunit [Chloroflexota bacterium]
MTDLRSRALVSAFVIFAVLLLFLRSFRSAGVVFMTIAFSVLISLNLIYFGGMTLNLLTLMGLAMGFGLIVDNAIVVLESVFRRWQAGRAAVDAATEGTRQVVLPILTSTATTLIVFVPFVYLQGELRVFYVPLAIVVALTLGASLLVAFTFIPALAARVLPRVRRDEAATDQAPRSQPGATGIVRESATSDNARFGDALV